MRISSSFRVAVAILAVMLLAAPDITAQGVSIKSGGVAKKQVQSVPASSAVSTLKVSPQKTVPQGSSMVLPDKIFYELYVLNDSARDKAFDLEMASKWYEYFEMEKIMNEFMEVKATSASPASQANASKADSFGLSGVVASVKKMWSGAPGNKTIDKPSIAKKQATAADQARISSYVDLNAVRLHIAARRAELASMEKMIDAKMALLWQMMTAASQSKPADISPFLRLGILDIATQMRRALTGNLHAMESPSIKIPFDYRIQLDLYLLQYAAGVMADENVTDEMPDTAVHKMYHGLKSSPDASGGMAGMPQGTVNQMADDDFGQLGAVTSYTDLEASLSKKLTRDAISRMIDSFLVMGTGDAAFAGAAIMSAIDSTMDRVSALSNAQSVRSRLAQLNLNLALIAFDSTKHIALQSDVPMLIDFFRDYREELSAEDARSIPVRHGLFLYNRENGEIESMSLCRPEMNCQKVAYSQLDTAPYMADHVDDIGSVPPYGLDKIKLKNALCLHGASGPGMSDANLVSSSSLSSNLGEVGAVSWSSEVLPRLGDPIAISDGSCGLLGSIGKGVNCGSLCGGGGGGGGGNEGSPGGCALGSVHVLGMGGVEGMSHSCLPFNPIDGPPSASMSGSGPAGGPPIETQEGWNQMVYVGGGACASGELPPGIGGFDPLKAQKDRVASMIKEHLPGVMERMEKAASAAGISHDHAAGVERASQMTVQYVGSGALTDSAKKSGALSQDAKTVNGYYDKQTNTAYIDQGLLGDPARAAESVLHEGGVHAYGHGAGIPNKSVKDDKGNVLKEGAHHELGGNTVEAGKMKGILPNLGGAGVCGDQQDCSSRCGALQGQIGIGNSCITGSVGGGGVPSGSDTVCPGPLCDPIEPGPQTSGGSGGLDIVIHRGTNLTGPCGGDEGTESSDDKCFNVDCANPGMVGMIGGMSGAENISGGGAQGLVDDCCGGGGNSGGGPNLWNTKMGAKDPLPPWMEESNRKKAGNTQDNVKGKQFPNE